MIQKLGEHFKAHFSQVLFPHQVHSNKIQIVDEHNRYDAFENTDGLLTALTNVALVTVVADCQAILLYDPKKQVIGNIHAGWRGVLSRISLNALQMMKKEFKSDPNDIQIYISPSIHQCCFEVEEEVYLALKNEFQDIDQTSLFRK